MVETLIILLSIVIIIVYKKYDGWFHKMIERKKRRIELQHLKADLIERNAHMNMQAYELQMKWMYHLEFLKVLKSKNAAANMHDLKLQKIEILKELAQYEIIKLKSLDSAMERHKIEDQLQQSNQRLEQMYEQLNESDIDAVS